MTTATKISRAKSTNTIFQKMILPIAWLIVGVPLAFAILNTFDKALVIFK